MSPKKVVVLLSGGLDSVLSMAELLAKPVTEVERVHALIFDYGQSSLVEIACAKTICEHWRVPYQIAKIQLMTGSDTHVEIPARNLIFVAYAASLAMRMHYNCVAIGAEPDSTFTDSTVDFIERADYLLSSFDVELIAPVKFYANKYELVSRALDLGVPLHLCHSSRSNLVDGKCKTSSLFLDALQRLFPAIEPIELLAQLSKLKMNYDKLIDTYHIYHEYGTFKYASALFSLCEKTNWENTKVYSTGSWMRDLSSVAKLLGKSDCFEFEKTGKMADLATQVLNCNSQAAQWGFKQVVSLLPRPRYLKSVACRVTQGHFANALKDLGYKIELPAYRNGAYIETDTLSKSQSKE